MTDDPNRLYPTSGVIVELELTGCVVPYAGEQPVLMCVDGAPPEDRFVAVFSRVEGVAELWRAYPGLPTYDRLKVIMNGPEFVESLFANGYKWLRIAFDPRRHANGKLRFTEVFPRGN